MLTSFDIFSKLPGIWSFVRTINNAKEPLLSGIATGNASITQVLGEKNLLHYQETGIFDTVSGTKYSFSKEYFFAFNEDTKNIEKYFAQDGLKAGLFYIFGTNYTGEHLCVKDHYQAHYEFPNDHFQEFSLIYKATGPKKEYVSNTKYKLNTFLAAHGT